MSMARERWVSPPLAGREPPPAWRVGLGFRLAVVLVLAVLVLLAAVAYRHLSGSGPDPAVGALPPTGVSQGPVRAAG